MNRKGLLPLALLPLPCSLTKEQDAAPYLRAPAISGNIAITPEPLYLTSNAMAEGQGLRRGHLQDYPNR
jgi:hypothetical protein